MIVDDDAIFRRYLQAMLAAFGFLPNYAENAQTALSVIVRITPDLILTDIYMPLGDGLELINTLGRRRDPTPIIAMSRGAHPDYDVLRAAAALGADGCIAMPIRAERLLELIRETVMDWQTSATDATVSVPRIRAS